MARTTTRTLGRKAGARRGVITHTLSALNATSLPAIDTTFIAPCKGRLLGMRAAWSTAGGSGAVLTLYHCTGTTAPASGVKLGDLALTTTANTVMSHADLTGATAALKNRAMAAGDRLCGVSGGTLTGLDGMCLTLEFVPDPDQLVTIQD